MPFAAVPEAYRGVWRRTLYAAASEDGRYVEDRATRVVWLQTRCWHADLRVPQDRPDFSSVTSLAGCDRDRLLWLASQTAFAGITVVEGRFCTWHRLFDLRPAAEKDIGEMAWREDGTLVERHPRGLYREHWQRQTDGGATERVDSGAEGVTRWLQWGKHAMLVVPRPLLPEDHDLFGDPATLDDEGLRMRAGLEISHACYDGENWRIELSTHPWREGMCTNYP